MKEQPPNKTWLMARLRRVIGMFFRSPVGKRAKVLAALLLLLMLCINGMNVANSYVGRYFMSAIEKRDAAGFAYYAWAFVGVFAASTTVSVFFRFTEERLGLLWRDWMTQRVVGIYVGRNVYLRLEETQAVTNPDQRIAEDIRSLAVSTLSFVLMILNSVITIVSFAGVLWNISPTLFFVSMLYAIVGSGLVVKMGRPLIKLNYRQSDLEANFRSELQRVRKYAEGIAITGNESLSRERLQHRVRQLVENFRIITSVNRNLGFFTTGYNYMIQLIPTLIVAPIFIRQGVEFGIIGQSAMAFAIVVAALSLIVTQFQSISVYASVVTRLGELVEASDKVIERENASGIHHSMTADHFTFSNLTLLSCDEDGHLLLDKLNASFLPGRRVLVHGENEAARLALFRAAAGLHDKGTGEIARPPAGKVAFLPEQPFLPPGTLREILLPPQANQGGSDAAIRAVLDEVGLEEVIAKHDGVKTPHLWHDLLSLCELQLMSVARAILSGAEFVLLDRPDSALDCDELKRVLRLMAARGMTCVTFGKGPVDPDLHDAGLEIQCDGSWNQTGLA